MSIKQNYKFIQISVEDLLYEGKRLGLDTHRSEEIVQQTLGQIPYAFEKAGKEYGLEETAAQVLDDLRQLSVVRFVSDYWS